MFFIIYLYKRRLIDGPIAALTHTPLFPPRSSPCSSPCSPPRSSSRSSPVHGEPAFPRPPGTPTSPTGAGGFHARGSPSPHHQQHGDGRGGGGGGRGNGTVSPGGWVQDRALPGFVRKTRRRRLVEDAPKLGVKIHTHPVRTNCMTG